MKAILISIKPKYVSMILNKVKTIEVRKRFPSDYVGWVYIYCTKNGKYLFKDLYAEKSGEGKLYYVDDKEHDSWSQKINGKVVARFWCGRVEEITTRQDRFKEFMFYETSLDMEDLCKQSCLDYNELDDYLYGENGYAIHITNLEIFEKPKEISNFEIRATEGDVKFNNIKGKMLAYKPLSRAPQSWCYIEI